jgi:hypothetical protein
MSMTTSTRKVSNQATLSHLRYKDTHAFLLGENNLFKELLKEKDIVCDSAKITAEKVAGDVTHEFQYQLFVQCYADKKISKDTKGP